MSENRETENICKVSGELKHYKDQNYQLEKTLDKLILQSCNGQKIDDMDDLIIREK